MKIKGFETLTLLDYPGRIAATVFTEGCNFRCPFCHNASLVDVRQTGETIDPREVLSHLDKRRGKLTGLCITGGEPLMQSGLLEFIQSVKALGYAVKLDTNGSMPSVLAPLLKGGWVDYIAMDIKNCREKYALTAGLAGRGDNEALLGKILESIELIKSSGIPYEFRTTVVRELHTLEDVLEIGEWLAGEESYFLQAFEDSGDVLSRGMTACSKEEMQTLCEALKRFVPKAALRGV
jgi:pyruvate formate lyase activating enzyme